MSFPHLAKIESRGVTAAQAAEAAAQAEAVDHAGHED